MTDSTFLGVGTLCILNEVVVTQIYTFKNAYRILYVLLQLLDTMQKHIVFGMLVLLQVNLKHICTNVQDGKQVKEEMRKAFEFIKSSSSDVHQRGKRDLQKHAKLLETQLSLLKVNGDHNLKKSLDFCKTKKYYSRPGSLECSMVFFFFFFVRNPRTLGP